MGGLKDGWNMRKIKYKSAKFFGYKGELRYFGKRGKKRSYGHYSGMPSMRTRAEIKNADDLRQTING